MSERLYRERLWGAELGEQVTRPTLAAGESAYPVFDESGHFLEWLHVGYSWWYPAMAGVLERINAAA